MTNTSILELLDSVEDKRRFVREISGVLHDDNTKLSEADRVHLKELRAWLAMGARLRIEPAFAGRLSRPLTQEIKRLGRRAKQHQPEKLAVPGKIILGDGFIVNYFGILTGIADDESYVTMTIEPTGEPAFFFYQSDHELAELVVIES